MLDGICRQILVEARQGPDDGILGHDLAGTQEKQLQKRDFPGGNIQRHSGTAEGSRRQVKRDAAELDDRAPQPRLPPEQHADARLEFRDIERLDHVIVGAQVETLHPFLRRSPGREDHHRRLVLSRAHCPQHVKPVHFGKVEIEDDQVIGFRRCDGFRRRSIGYRIHRIAATAQDRCKTLRQRLIVLHEKNAHGHPLSFGNLSAFRLDVTERQVIVQLVQTGLLVHCRAMKLLFIPFLVIVLLPARLVEASTTVFPAVSGRTDAPVLVVYSSLDEPLAQPMIAGFQAVNPDVAVRYEDMLTGEIYDRIVRETEAGQKTADFAFSSAMDLQVKLANDGYAQRSDLPMSDQWPGWANWRNTAYALTFEPAVFVYHKPSFEDKTPPSTRAEFVDFLREQGNATYGRIGTYDIERSGVGFLFMSRDQEQFGDIWSVIQAMGAAGVKLYSTSQAILERVADGRFLLGYNILGSYAADWASRHPEVGIVLPKDYTVVMSRIGLVPQAAASPELGRRYLEFFMSKQGQTIMARELQIPAVSPEVSGNNTATTMREMLGGQLKPVPVSPGLMVYLDQVKRARLVARWNEVLRLQ